MTVDSWISAAMQTQYVKRYRMEISFQQTKLPKAVLPEGYRWEAWSPSLIERHALAKWHSFEHEMDSVMFASLATYPGCEGLMRSIARHRDFLPQATWLVEYAPHDLDLAIPCATIQGLAPSSITGAIQNVGVVPEHRGRGLGRAIVLKALRGFRGYGLTRVSLDVTADNEKAVELYRSLGFCRTSTSYREIAQPVEAV